MRPLMTDMTQKHPSGRPSVEDVMFRFEAGNRSLDPVELQSPIISRNSSFFNKLLRNMSHRFRSSTPDLIEPISIDPWSGSVGCFMFFSVLPLKRFFRFRTIVPHRVHRRPLVLDSLRSRLKETEARPNFLI